MKINFFKLLSFLAISLFIFSCSPPLKKESSNKQVSSPTTPPISPFVGNKYDVIAIKNMGGYKVNDKIATLEVQNDLKTHYIFYNTTNNTPNLDKVTDAVLPSDGSLDNIYFGGYRDAFKGSKLDIAGNSIGNYIITHGSSDPSNYEVFNDAIEFRKIN